MSVEIELASNASHYSHCLPDDIQVETQALPSSPLAMRSGTLAVREECHCVISRLAVRQIGQLTSSGDFVR